MSPPWKWGQSQFLKRSRILTPWSGSLHQKFVFNFLIRVYIYIYIHTYTYIRTYVRTRWFKYDRDWLCVNKSQFVPVIFEPPCIYIHTYVRIYIHTYIHTALAGVVTPTTRLTSLLFFLLLRYVWFLAQKLAWVLGRVPNWHKAQLTTNCLTPTERLVILGSITERLVDFVGSRPWSWT